MLLEEKQSCLSLANSYFSDCHERSKATYYALMTGNSQDTSTLKLEGKIVALAGRAYRKDYDSFMSLVTLHNQIWQKQIDAKNALLRYKSIYSQFKANTGLKR